MLEEDNDHGNRCELHLLVSNNNLSKITDRIHLYLIQDGVGLLQAYGDVTHILFLKLLFFKL